MRSKRMRQQLQRRVIQAISVAALLVSAPSYPVDLSGSIFDEAAQAYSIDPLLLYSIALAESAKSVGDGSISPWPWTLRSPTTPYYAVSKEQALEILLLLLEQGSSVDIGIMQVNWNWHGDDYTSAEELLDLRQNVFAGAKILAISIASAPDDIELGIGRYHTWADVARARNYGRRVLAIRRNIIEYRGK